MMQLVLFALAAGSQVQENPIRRIVNLLQKMQTEVSAEQARDDDLNEKFACYCKTNDGALSESTAELREKIPQIEASIKEAESLKEQLDQELAQHKEDRANAKQSIDAATKQREKEAAAFADESAELSANIAACGKAIDAIAKGMAGSFLQSQAASALKRVLDQASAQSLGRYERGVLTEFLSADQSYAPGSGEIVGILKQLKENMEGELDEATKEENAAIAEFEGLVAAKEKEIQAATEAIETKMARVGEVAVDIVNKKNDLDDAQDSLDDDTKFLMELKKNCASEGSEYEERKVARAEELVAISETIKILNDDDALELFKKTLPSPALIQVTRSNQDLRQSALEQLAKVQQPSTQFSFIALALQGKKAGFEKVLKMVDDMVVTLGQEQKDDDTHRDWCLKEFDVSEDNEKDTQRKIKNLETQIAETTDAIATLTDELAALAQKIKDLDTMVAEATDSRKDEHALFVQTSAENNAALQLLEVAKNRLNKFYNPAVYKPPPKRELTEEERLYVASGGVLTTPAPGGIAGTGIAVFSQMRARAMMKDAPPPPPETVDAYQKSDSSGPVALIDRLKNDLAKDQQAVEIEEKQAQKDYEELMADSAATRAQDAKTISEKESQKAGLEGDLEAAKEQHQAAKTELLGLHEYIAQLHGSCDFLLQNYDNRKEARANEIDALKKAKAVLSGADYSFLQRRSIRH